MNKKINHGTISTVLCMISAGWLAILSENFLPPFVWIIYSFGAGFGIIHLFKKKDRPIMLMYLVWLIFDIIAVVRLVIL